jgi:hypothetical protein
MCLKINEDAKEYYKECILPREKEIFNLVELDNL